ncbi:MAG: hypothetical protein HY940_04580 [Gammaproteobacteria bacterium]|nr:hypothetical protein [Gammaproteobacteria bacterium]
MCAIHCSVASDRHHRQHGGTTLVIALLMLLAAGLLVQVVASNTLATTRMQGNEHQLRRAQAAADSAFEYAVQWLRMNDPVWLDIDSYAQQAMIPAPSAGATLQLTRDRRYPDYLLVSVQSPLTVDEGVMIQQQYLYRTPYNGRWQVSQLPGTWRDF